MLYLPLIFYLIKIFDQMLLCVQYILDLHPSWKREPFPVDTDAPPPQVIIKLFKTPLWFSVA